MSYEKKVDDLVAQYIARYQEEQTMVKEMAEAMGKPAMAHGYPARIYHPSRLCQVPRFRNFISRSGGCLSNGVPWVLGTHVHNGSLLGIYNPPRSL
jgi:hypothetical protein